MCAYVLFLGNFLLRKVVKATVRNLGSSLLGLRQLGAHGQASFPVHLHPVPNSYVILGPLDEFREGPEQQIPQSLCSLHWQRCELCPHKDGALKRTDNGGEGTLNPC